jgi:hypothetical protein
MDDGVSFHQDDVVTFRKERGEIVLLFPARIRFSYAMRNGKLRVDLVEADNALRVQPHTTDFSACAIARADGSTLAVIEIRALDPIALF